jgi:hypothetical protein
MNLTQNLLRCRDAVTLLKTPCRNRLEAVGKGAHTAGLWYDAVADAGGFGALDEAVRAATPSDVAAADGSLTPAQWEAIITAAMTIAETVMANKN